MAEGYEAGAVIRRVRERLQMYLGTSTADYRKNLVSYVVDDLFDAGHVDFRVMTLNDLTIIVSSTDWMQPLGRHVSELFEQLLPAKRTNSLRAEILVAACCSEFGTGGLAGEHPSGISSGDLPEGILSSFSPQGRWLAFRMKQDYVALPPV